MVFHLVHLFFIHRIKNYIGSLLFYKDTSFIAFLQIPSMYVLLEYLPYSVVVEVAVWHKLLHKSI